MKRFSIAALSGFVLSTPLLTGHLLAAEWERGASLGLSTYYSDNICLSELDKKSGEAATVRPDVYLRGRGARSNLYFQGSVVYDSLADSDLECRGQGALRTNREAVIPSLRYLGDLELVDEWLTLESDAFVGTNPIDPFRPGGNDEFNGRDNTNITSNYGAGATLARRLFSTADLRIRYYHNEQQNAVNLLGDSSEDRAEFDLGTEPANNRLTVGIAGRYSNVEFEDSIGAGAFETKFRSAEARAALRLSSNWQLTSLFGEEWNEFNSFRQQIDGTYWDVGLRWTPNTRLVVSAGTGERFFGSTPRMSIQYRHRRSELSADYARSLTLPRNLRAAANRTFPRLNTGSELTTDPLPRDLLLSDGEPTFFGNTPIINERMSLTYRFSARRTNITINAADSRQSRLEDSGEAQFTSLGFSMSRALSSALSGNLGVSWDERDAQGGTLSNFGLDSEMWRVDIGLNRRIGRDTTLSMSLRHTNRDSEAGFNRFDENRIVFTARHQF